MLTFECYFQVSNMIVQGMISVSEENKVSVMLPAEM